MPRHNLKRKLIPRTLMFQENDGSLGSVDTKPTLGLEFEDLSILETGISSHANTNRECASFTCALHLLNDCTQI